MKRTRTLPLVLLTLSVPFLTVTEVRGQNPILRELAKEDQEYQRGRKVARTNEDRIKIVLAQIGQGAVKTPEDQANAAIVLQHTGMMFCAGQLTGKSPDNYLLAHHLAKSAYEAGYKEARFLVAQTLDRYLSMTEGYQKYGTNRLNNPETGAEEWVPIDRQTPDSEREKYGVPPLAELLKKFPERAPKKKP